MDTILARTLLLYSVQLCSSEKAFGRDASVCDLTAPILDISPTGGQPVKHLYRYHWHKGKAFGGDLTAPILTICNHRWAAREASLQIPLARRKSTLTALILDICNHRGAAREASLQSTTLAVVPSLYGMPLDIPNFSSKNASCDHRCTIFFRPLRKIPTATSRRSLARVSVLVWLIILSDQLLIIPLVSYCLTN
ncbi:hypothetical protein P3L10_019675 [Capsicum annuum]